MVVLKVEKPFRRIGVNSSFQQTGAVALLTELQDLHQVLMNIFSYKIHSPVSLPQVNLFKVL